jgi:hypothetical protein
MSETVGIPYPTRGLVYGRSLATGHDAGKQGEKAPKAGAVLASVKVPAGTYLVQACAWQTGTNDKLPANAYLGTDGEAPNPEPILPTGENPVWVAVIMVFTATDYPAVAIIENAGEDAVYHGIVIATPLLTE